MNPTGKEQTGEDELLPGRVTTVKETAKRQQNAKRKRATSPETGVPSFPEFLPGDLFLTKNLFGPGTGLNQVKTGVYVYSTLRIEPVVNCHEIGFNERVLGTVLSVTEPEILEYERHLNRILGEGQDARNRISTRSPRFIRVLVQGVIGFISTALITPVAVG